MFYRNIVVIDCGRLVEPQYIVVNSTHLNVDIIVEDLIGFCRRYLFMAIAVITKLKLGETFLNIQPMLKKCLQK